MFDGAFITVQTVYICTKLKINISLKGVTDLPPVTHQNEASSKCVSGWTEWINQDKTFVASKYDQKINDREPLPDSLVLVIHYITLK